MAKTPITVAHGDGIGPEIMKATLAIIEAAGAQLDIETIEIGEQVYKRGVDVGIEPSAWESLRRTKVFLKAPITTPQGGGYKSLNVTIRKSMGQFANIRPCRSFAPFVKTKHPKMDVVIVRENEEDLYAGIEHQQTPEVVQCLKLISVPGCERIVRYAFEYAKRNNRKKVTCFSKDNIMKQTDGLFHKIFEQIAPEYPDILHEHWIVDIGAAKLADTPENFDVVVMPNLYGDILSDVAAQIAGSVGLAGSANIGDHGSMFEAIHGSAPRVAGQNRANPSGLLMGAVMMLVHIGQTTVAERVHNAWLRTLEEGYHTYDIFDEKISRQKLGTQEFAQAVIDHLGQEPEQLAKVTYLHQPKSITPIALTIHPHPTRVLIGTDVFCCSDPKGSANDLAQKIQSAVGSQFQLKLIGNRGVEVWPNGLPETSCTDHWRCRIFASAGQCTPLEVAELLQRIANQGIEFIKTEGLYLFDGKPAFSGGQE